MESISIRLEKKLLQDVNHLAQKNRQSLSACLRDLIALGLRVQTYSDKNNAPSDTTKNTLDAILAKLIIETSFISRELLLQHNPTSQAPDEHLKQLSRKAQKIVEGYLGNDVFKGLGTNGHES